MRARQAGPPLAHQRKEDYPEDGRLGGIVANIEAALHQSAYRAVVVLPEIVVVVLRDAQKPCSQQHNDHGP